MPMRPRVLAAAVMEAATAAVAVAPLTMLAALRALEEGLAGVVVRESQALLGLQAPRSL